MSCRNLSSWQCTRIVAPAVATKWHGTASRLSFSYHTEGWLNISYAWRLEWFGRCMAQRAKLTGIYISPNTVETLYSTIYYSKYFIELNFDKSTQYVALWIYSKYFIELNFDKSTQYVALWTHKRHPIPRPFGRAMECLLWVLQQKLTVF